MELASKLRELLGPTKLSQTILKTVAAHSADKWFAAHEPDAVVLARSPGDVRPKLLSSHRAKKIPVTRREGGGFWLCGRIACRPRAAGIALSLMQMESHQGNHASPTPLRAVETGSLYRET